MTKVLGKDLKVGMILEEKQELITHIDLEGKDECWEGIPNIKFIDLYSPYWGEYCHTINPDAEYKVAELSDEEYRENVIRCVEELREAINDRLDEIIVLVRLIGE